MKWKGNIPEGKVYEKPVSSMDIFMTTTSVAECPLPDDRVYDGVNLLPFIKGQDTGSPHEVFYWRADHIHGVRKGNWKYLMSTRDNWIELYNMAEDKFEQIDLNTLQPDVLQELRQTFDAWEKDLAPPLWPRIMDHIFIIDGKTYKFPA
jgi:arylsulfatase A-like enzyme